MKKVLYMLTFILLTTSVLSQKEYHNWVFGDSCYITFDTPSGNPEFVKPLAVSTFENTSVISNNIGELQYFSFENYIYNSDNELIYDKADGNNSSTQGGCIFQISENRFIRVGSNFSKDFNTQTNLSYNYITKNSDNTIVSEKIVIDSTHNTEALHLFRSKLIESVYLVTLDILDDNEKGLLLYKFSNNSFKLIQEFRLNHNLDISQSFIKYSMINNLIAITFPKENKIYVAGFMNVNQNSMLPTSTTCNDASYIVSNKWNFNSIYCSNDAVSSSTRDGDTVGFVTKWETDLELEWGEWIKDQAPYYVKALDVSVRKTSNEIALVGITNGGDYILPSLWTTGYGNDTQNNSNYSNDDIDGWVIVIKDEGYQRYAEWGNLIEGRVKDTNDNNNYDANDYSNNVEWIISGPNNYDLIVAGHSNTDYETFDQFAGATVLDTIEFEYSTPNYNHPKIDNDIFMLMFNYIDTTSWAPIRVAFYGEGISNIYPSVQLDDQLYDMYYNPYVDSIVFTGITKSYHRTWDDLADSLVDFTNNSSFDKYNESYLHGSRTNNFYDGFIIGTSTGLGYGWGTFFADDEIGTTVDDEFDLIATSTILQDNNEVLIAGYTEREYTLDGSPFQDENKGGIDGFIARLDLSDNVFSKEIAEEFQSIFENKEPIFTIYPNPSSDLIKIANNKNRDILGMKLYSNTGLLLNRYFSDTNEIDISGFSSGVYHLQISYIGGMKTISFIKK